LTLEDLAEITFASINIPMSFSHV